MREGLDQRIWEKLDQRLGRGTRPEAGGGREDQMLGEGGTGPEAEGGGK